MAAEGEALEPIFSVIWRRRWLVFGIACVVVAIGAVYTLVVPAIWEAKASIIFPVRTPSPLGMGNFDQQSLAASVVGGPTPIKVYGGMLKSERVLNYVAREANIKRRDLREMRNVVDQSTESTISVTARHRDREVARRVVALHLEALEKVNVVLNKPLASVDTDALAKQLKAQQSRVEAMERQLLDLQSASVTGPSVSTSGTGKESAVVPAPAKWTSTLRELEIEETRLNGAIRAAEGQISKVSSQGNQLPSEVAPVEKWRERLTELEYELRVKELTFAPGAEEIKKLKKTIAITRRQLQAELQKYVSASKAGMVGVQNKLPDLLAERVGLQAQIAAVSRLVQIAPGETMQLSRLMRQLTTETAILQQLQSQFRLAEVQESRDPNRWEVLDLPEVDDIPVNKSLFKNGVISLLLGLVIGSMAALLAPRKRASNIVGGSEFVEAT